MLRRAAAAALVSFAALATPILAVPPAAYAQGEPPGPVVAPFIDGKLERVEGKVLVLQDNKGTFPMTEEGLRHVTGRLEAGLVKIGSWVRVFLDQTGSVKAIEAIETPTSGTAVEPATTETQRRADLKTFLLSLKPTERFLLNKEEVTFIQFDGSMLLVAIPGLKGSVYKSLKEVKEYKRIEGAAAAVPVAPPPPREVDASTGIRPGYWYKINGESGLCVRANDRLVVLDLGGHGKWKEFARDSIESFSQEPEPAMPGSAPVAPGGGGSTGGAGAAKDPVAAAMEEIKEAKYLDWGANRWTIPAKVRHSIQGKLLVGARLEVAFRGFGNMISPEKETEILRAIGGELRREDDTFTYQDTRHYYKHEGEKWIIGEISDQRAPVQVPLNNAIFPDVPETVAVTMRLLGPVLEEKAHVTYPLGDVSKHLIPFSDDRAIPHLLKAYAERGEAARAAALRAMAASGSQKLLPFLLLEYYSEQGEAADRLKRTIALQHDTAEEFLIQLLKDNGYAQGFAIPNVQGGIERKKPVADPERMLAKVIELLDVLGAERGFPFVLAHTRAQNELVRETARSFFTRRPAHAVPWLVRKLRGQTIVEAKPLLMDIEARSPGALAAYIREGLKIDDPAFETSLQGLPPEEIAGKQLDYIVKYVKSGDAKLVNVDDQVYVARDALSRLGTEEAEITALKRDLAKSYVALAVRGAPEAEQEPRRYKVSLLRRAVMLDAANQTARTELARAFIEIAREMREGSFLRSGPGEEYRRIHALVSGEPLTPVPLPDGMPDTTPWRYVKRSDETIGFVHGSVVLEGKTRLHVSQGHRLLEDIQRYFLRARALDPERADDIDETLAEMALGLSDEAAAAGEWKAAFDRCRTASGLTHGKYRLKLAYTFLRANLLVTATGVLGLIACAAALLWRGRGEGAGAPARAEARGKSAAGKAASVGGASSGSLRKPAPSEPLPTKQVPS